MMTVGTKTFRNQVDTYSQLPNKPAGHNKPVGWEKITLQVQLLHKLINEQGGIFCLFTIRAPLSAALNKSRTPNENMLTFAFYFIFELKLHQRLKQNSKKSAALNGARTVYITEFLY